MTVEEILKAAQGLSFEERRKLIQGLFQQLPPSTQLSGSVVSVGDLEAGTQTIREMVSRSLERTAAQLD